MPAPKGSKFNPVTRRFEMPGASSKKKPSPPRDARGHFIPPAGDVPKAVPDARDYTSQGTPEPDEEGPPRPISRGTPESEDKPVDNEDAPFVTAKDVKDKAGWQGQARDDKDPTQRGFIADLIAGSLQELHETEVVIFNHPAFQHTPAKERIDMALGRYVEANLDPTKYGIVVLLVALVVSELAPFAIYARDVNAAKKAAEGKRKGKA